jgi:hypothetical protein
MKALLTSLDACDVTRVRITGDCQFTVRFKDGLVAELNLSQWLAQRHGSMVEPLKSPAFFADVTIEDGVLTWPNGYDLDPTTVRNWAENGL